jgi:mercuric ion transport protein
LGGRWRPRRARRLRLLHPAAHVLRLGVSGAWIGNLTRLAPYQPFFIAGAAVCLAYGYWLVYRAPKVACGADEACARPLPNRLVKLALVLAAALVAVAIGFDLLAPMFLT